MVLPSPGEITEGERAFGGANQIAEAAGNAGDSGRVRTVHQSLDLAVDASVTTTAGRSPAVSFNRASSPGSVFAAASSPAAAKNP